MRLLILVLLLPLFVQGQTTPLNKFYGALEKQFTAIDSLRATNIDAVEICNDSVLAIIKNYKSDILNFPDTLDYDLVYIAKSSDKNFALVSWDTRLGGTMIDFATVAIYRTGKEVTAVLLLDSTEGDAGNTLLHFNAVHTITTTNGKKIYLGWGNGQGSTAIPFQELRAFSIVRGRLEAPIIFPGDGSSIFISFDRSAFKQNEKVPTIKVLDGGKTIRIPVPAENGGVTGKFRSLAFNGQVYKPAK